MRMSKTLMVVLLGSAALLPMPPAWADPTPPANNQPANTQPAKPATTAPSGSSATTTPSAPPLTVTGKPASTDGARDEAMQMHRNDRKAFMDARLAALHAGLELTASQQPLWDPVEGALRDLVKARHAMHELRHEDMEPTARLKQHGERLIAMGQAIGKLADATGPLLGSLTAEQKGRLPVLLHGFRPHRLVKQAFAVEGGRDHMRGGMKEGDGMRDGERDWHRRFADRDDRGYGRRGFDDRDGGYGERHWHRHDWDRDGRADRGDGMDRGRFEREDGPSWHHRDHGMNGGGMNEGSMGDRGMGDHMGDHSMANDERTGG